MKKRPLENWWGNGPMPDPLWTNEEWAVWMLRVEKEDELVSTRPCPRPRSQPKPRYLVIGDSIYHSKSSLVSVYNGERWITMTEQQASLIKGGMEPPLMRAVKETK